MRKYSMVIKLSFKLGPNDLGLHYVKTWGNVKSDLKDSYEEKSAQQLPSPASGAKQEGNSGSVLRILAALRHSTEPSDFGSYILA